MKNKILIIEWFLIVFVILTIVGYAVYTVDPFIHYHKPYTNRYYYTLDNERSQNDGIIKHFEYDAMITGSSMTENFKTTDMDEMFGVNSIKCSFSGASYKEINDNLKVAFKHNNNLKTIVRCLDMNLFLSAVNDMRTGYGTYPTYLYDNNPFNDVEYLFNRDVIWDRVYPMLKDNDNEGYVTGITSFDDYSNWRDRFNYGRSIVIPDGITVDFGSVEQPSLSDKEKETIKENIEVNVLALAKEHPDVDFYYFVSPYSIAWWGQEYNDGLLEKQFEAEQLIIELILEQDNIRLYSFNNRTDIITDLNNYMDDVHYGYWINKAILKWMRDGDYILTKDNYKEYLAAERKFYSSYDYNSLNEQEDNDSDELVAALLNEEITGKSPKIIIDGDVSSYEFRIDNVEDYDYLVFWARNIDSEYPVRVYDENEQELYGQVSDAEKFGEWQQIGVELDKLETKGLIIRNNYYVANSIEPEEPIFRDVQLR